MTTHYVDVQLLPDPEFSPAHVLGALYGKLHRTLVDLSAGDIGVSFPQYSLAPRSLGALMRLHGTAAALQRLLSTDWERGLRDHIAVGEVRPVPEDVEHRAFRRRQFKTNAERLRRRRMRRKGESYDEAAAAIPDSMERQPNLPFIRLHSSSTGQQYCVFLMLGEPEAGPQPATFNTYGLSATGTIPWF